jgi:hypothetical protein
VLVALTLFLRRLPPMFLSLLICVAGYAGIALKLLSP